MIPVMGNVSSDVVEYEIILLLYALVQDDSKVMQAAMYWLISHAGNPMQFVQDHTYVNTIYFQMQNSGC